jgi:hypothetical protein
MRRTVESLETRLLLNGDHAWPGGDHFELPPDFHIPADFELPPNFDLPPDFDLPIDFELNDIDVVSIANVASGLLGFEIPSEQEPNDTRDQATPIELSRPWDCDEVCAEANGVHGDQPVAKRPFIVPGFGDEQHGAVMGNLDSGDASTGDADFFTFTVDAERKILVHFGGDAAAQGVLPQLLDADGNVLATAEAFDWDDDGAIDAATLDHYTRSGGQLFVQLGPQPGVASPSEYMIGVSVFPEPNVEHEPNNDAASANRIELNPEFIFSCDFVCPLAARGRDGRHDTPPEAGICMVGVPSPCNGPEWDGVGDDESTDQSHYGVDDMWNDPANLIFPPPWEQDESLHAFVEGELKNPCSDDPLCAAVADVAPDADYFVFEVPPVFQLDIHLWGPAAEHGANLALLDGEKNELASDTDPNDGIGIEWPAEAGGVFYLRVDGAIDEVPPPDPVCPRPSHPIKDGDGEEHCYVPEWWDPTAYQVEIFADEITPPNQGAGENEPNDSFDQANHLDLHRLYYILPGPDRREAEALGIGGGPTGDQDYYQFDVHAGERVNVGVHASLEEAIDAWIEANGLNEFGDPIDTAYLGGTPLFDEATGKYTDRIDYILANHPELDLGQFQVIVYDGAGNEVGRSDDATRSSDVVFTADADGAYFALVSASGDELGAAYGHYRLFIGAERETIEGPDEFEPNDSFEDADWIDLEPLPVFFVPGMEMFGGDALGIAGGSSNDQDFFAFDVFAGEHVTVGVGGFVDGFGFLDYDPSGVATNGARKADIGPHGHSRLPGMRFGVVEAVIFDADGNEIGRTGGADAMEPVVFETDANATYYARVSAPDATDDTVQYRLGVMTQGFFDEGAAETPDEEPLIITLEPNEEFTFVDEDGDTVTIEYNGRGGECEVVFTGPDADGADIADITIEGFRKGKSLNVSTDGSADVGSVEIQGVLGRSRRGGGGGFGTVNIDGNLGEFSSNLNVRSLLVDGILGAIDAPGNTVQRLEASIFDQAMADVGGIGRVQVDQDLVTALFGEFLPYDPAGSADPAP